MKNVYLAFLLLFVAGGLQAQIVWDNFEDQRRGTYDFNSGTFIPYFENPDQSGVNTSRVAAAYTRNPGDLFDVIVLDGQMADLTDYRTGAKTMTMDVWSPAPGATVQISLENSELALPDNFPGGRHSAYFATTTTSMAWETLTFVFSDQPDASVADDNVDRIVILFEPNTNNASQWYWDNFNGPELADDPCAEAMTDNLIFNDFECQQNVDFTFSHASINFRRILNPDASGANTSDYVATYIRNAAEEFDVIIARTNGDRVVPNVAPVTLDVWDPGAPTNVRISLQFNADDGELATDLLGLDASTTAASTWETLSYDFSDIAGQTYNQIVILFDPGAFTDGQYYWDNLAFGDAVNTFDVIDEVANFRAYPNPTDGVTTFEYELNSAAQVALRIQNAAGQIVDQVWQSNQAPGAYRMPYDTQNLPAGLYFYTLSVDGKTATGKLVIR